MAFYSGGCSGPARSSKPDRMDRACLTERPSAACPSWPDPSDRVCPGYPGQVAERRPVGEAPAKKRGGSTSGGRSLDDG